MRMPYETIVCNLFAGPGAGKSSTMAGVYAELKWRGIDVEMATEYAKDKVWEESYQTLDCQTYVFGNQSHRLFRLKGKVEVIVTDSPLLLSVIYDKHGLPSFQELVLDEFTSYENVNVMLIRAKVYNPNGRMQTEEEAKRIDGKVRALLGKHSIPYCMKIGCRESVMEIADLIESMVQEKRKNYPKNKKK